MMQTMYPKIGPCAIPEDRHTRCELVALEWRKALLSDAFQKESYRWSDANVAAHYVTWNNGTGSCDVHSSTSLQCFVFLLPAFSKAPNKRPLLSWITWGLFKRSVTERKKALKISLHWSWIVVYISWLIWLVYISWWALNEQSKFWKTLFKNELLWKYIFAMCGSSSEKS